ncbi:ABC transporter substrate-binding protein [Treponema parvum]|uniref:ABC transporter substrate-binding protein n=1 Tax=Treponema parvum TaxID=138851 RepID=A0A975IEN3_9SPIR|nr:ABC transporter substrate-binding protein [Treponema parvum]QTQ13992.1 ABC transporter substrate-binding protein [Treponema parvum]
MNNYFSLKDTVYEVTEKYPELIELFAANGFENLKNKVLRNLVARSISVETALKSKHIDTDAFEKRMIETIESGKSTVQSGPADSKKNASECDVKLMGVLPCPIRMQMLEKLDNWLETQKVGINYELQAASMGIDWLKEHVVKSKDASELADIYLSAGYGFFFDKELMGHYKDEGVFEDITGIEKLNSDFDNDYIDLKDPRRQYKIIGVVPAIFMVNTALLGDRPMPKSWADLLKPEFENTIAVPMKDLDLFNAILLGIYTKYGKEGLAALGRGVVSSMHPAQMVKNGGRKTSDTPIVTVMPYFFTWMAKEEGPMKTVWPEDGAIISPIFFLSKKSSKDRVKPVVDFLFSPSMGSVLSADGKFPSTHPTMDNHLSKDKKFMWPGWDFIHSNDIAKVLKEAEGIFNSGMGGM